MEADLNDVAAIRRALDACKFTHVLHLAAQAAGPPRRGHPAGATPPGPPTPSLSHPHCPRNQSTKSLKSAGNRPCRFRYVVSRAER